MRPSPVMAITGLRPDPRNPPELGTFEAVVRGAANKGAGSLSYHDSGRNRKTPGIRAGNRNYLPAFLCIILFAGATALRAGDPAAPWVRENPVKVAFDFSDNRSDGQMVFTRDSVGILAWDSTAGALEPDDENGFDGAIRKRAFTQGERDSADLLMAMTRTWKGRKRYVCASQDGYAFTIWSDSLTLHCGNCFSCTDGISMPEAKMLARFGKLSLWLYRIKGGMDADPSRPD